MSQTKESTQNHIGQEEKENDKRCLKAKTRQDTNTGRNVTSFKENNLNLVIMLISMQLTKGGNLETATEIN